MDLTFVESERVSPQAQRLIDKLVVTKAEDLLRTLSSEEYRWAKDARGETIDELVARIQHFQTCSGHASVSDDSEKLRLKITEALSSGLLKASHCILVVADKQDEREIRCKLPTRDPARALIEIGVFAQWLEYAHAHDHHWRFAPSEYIDALDSAPSLYPGAWDGHEPEYSILYRAVADNQPVDVGILVECALGKKYSFHNDYFDLTQSGLRQHFEELWSYVIAAARSNKRKSKLSKDLEPKSKNTIYQVLARWGAEAIARRDPGVTLSQPRFDVGWIVSFEEPNSDKLLHQKGGAKSKELREEGLRAGVRYFRANRSRYKSATEAAKAASAHVKRKFPAEPDKKRNPRWCAWTRIKAAVDSDTNSR